MTNDIGAFYCPDYATIKFSDVMGVELWVNYEGESSPMLPAEVIGKFSVLMATYNHLDTNSGLYGRCSICGGFYDPHEWEHHYRLPQVLDLCLSCLHNDPVIQEDFRQLYAHGIEAVAKGIYGYQLFYGIMGLFGDN